MLSWLAGWIGVVFDRAWPVASGGAYLLHGAKLYPCRGTLPGLRGAAAFSGSGSTRSNRRAAPRVARRIVRRRRRPGARRRCILEHWKIRRWLFLGAGRLGDDAVLWGETITGRCQLGNTAQLGVTRLEHVARRDRPTRSTPTPMRSPSSCPAAWREALRPRPRLSGCSISRSPAWSQAKLSFVLPRMRIGIQACIGFDSVVGCWPEGVLLDSARLGRATVFSAAPNIDPGPRLGPQPRRHRSAHRMSREEHHVDEPPRRAPRAVARTASARPLTRNHYFTGKLLVERDFTDEQWLFPREDPAASPAPAWHGRRVRAGHPPIPERGLPGPAGDPASPALRSTAAGTTSWSPTRRHSTSPEHARGHAH